jgi:hypothetical protein
MEGVQACTPSSQCDAHAYPHFFFSFLLLWKTILSSYQIKTACLEFKSSMNINFRLLLLAWITISECKASSNVESVAEYSGMIL